jgi:hypothetical protein
MRYNRGDISDTMRAAIALSKKQRPAVYVYATGCGFLISKARPPFAQAHYIIENGHIEQIPT